MAPAAIASSGACTLGAGLAPEVGLTPAAGRPQGLYSGRAAAVYSMHW